MQEGGGPPSGSLQGGSHGINYTDSTPISSGPRASHRPIQAEARGGGGSPTRWLDSFLKHRAVWRMDLERGTWKASKHHVLSAGFDLSVLYWAHQNGNSTLEGTGTPSAWLTVGSQHMAPNKCPINAWWIQNAWWMNSKPALIVPEASIQEAPCRNLQIPTRKSYFLFP